jgi:YidC/Oxa1 family membrane protein insertase
MWPVYSNVFALLWGEVVHRPIFNALLVLLMLFGGSMGWAIIVLTLIVRALMRKTSLAGTEMASGMGDMQPKMQAIQEKYKDDPTKQQEEMMKLLKWGGGMLKGCLGMLIQIPVFIGLFYVIRDFAGGELILDDMYSFLRPRLGAASLDGVDTNFLGIDLLSSNNVVLTLIAAVLVFCQSKMMQRVKPQPKTPQAMPGGKNMPDPSKMMGTMNIVMVVMMWWLVWSTASGVGLYIVTTTLFTIIQYAIKYRPLIQAKLAGLMLTGGGSDKPEIIEG